jgi:hypothetical protein
VVEYEQKTQNEDTQHVNSQRQQKLKKIAVVAPTDAVVDPRTVMIEHLKWQTTRVWQVQLNAEERTALIIL